MAFSTKHGILAWNVWKNRHEPSSSEEALLLIKKLDFQKVILFSQLEWQYWADKNYQNIVEELHRQNKKLIVVNGAAHILINRPEFNIDYYTHPYNTMERTYFSLFEPSILQKYNQDRDQKIIHSPESLTYNFHFISMNNRAHKHRIKMIDLLAKYNLIENNAISWHDIISFYGYEYKYFSPKIITLTDNFSLSKEQAVVPAEYYQAFAQLCVESTVNEALIITDKTATPLILGKPFLSACCPLFHKHLQSLGFELYTEIFDYSFDEIIDDDIRFEMIAQNFHNLTKIPLHELNNLAKKIKDKLEYNKSVFKKIIFKLDYPKPIKDIIKIYEEENIELDHYTIEHHKWLMLMKEQDKYL
jgi:hypothetical protein